MKILILGGSGFLGEHLKNFLKKKKINISTCGRNYKNNIIIKSYNKINLKKTLLKFEPSIVINLVAITNVDGCEKKQKTCKEINTNISKILSEIYLDEKLNFHNIFISTDQLYDDKNNNNEENIKISNHYCKTKKNAEKYVKKINGCILRTNFFGINKNSKSLTNWIIESNKKKEIINVFENINFSPLYVNTLCKYIYHICIKKITGIYNLGSKGCISKSDFAYYIIRNLKLNLKLLNKKKYSEKILIAKRPKNMCMNSNKFFKKTKLKQNSSYFEIDLMLRDLKK